MGLLTIDIFAGPIIRRTSVDEVYIWIATIGMPSVSARLSVRDIVIAEGYAQSISLNEQIYVHLIRLVPQQGKFPTNKLITYAIGIPWGDGYNYTPFYFSILEGNLSYGNEGWLIDAEIFEQRLKKGERPNLPSFVIPSRLEQLNIAFGSCRKPHDPGEDAFVKIDALIGGNFQNPGKRAHVLYLGGDQIYADDVSPEAIGAIVSICKDYNLIEKLPGAPTHTISYKDRRAVMKKEGFTSGEAQNHLMGFGEYIAMYGLVWNRENWAGLPEIKDFSDGLSAARRVLANTPTYMIFDDHDVTDDWFITNEWRSNVIGKPKGRRIIANAMAAYFLFQGWGNNPAKFDYLKVKAVIEERKSKPKEFDSYFLGLNWEFDTPTNPVCYFLDTRTDRGGKGFPPLLKSSWVSTKINIDNKNMPFVLIAPGPMVTFPAIDEVQKIASHFPDNLGGPLGKYGADYESWAANPENYKSFFYYFKALNISKIVILSGDVHYGFSAIFSLYNKEKMIGLPNGYQIDCLQITSSALKNNAGKLSAAHDLSNWAYPEKLYFLYFQGKVEIAEEKRTIRDMHLTDLPKYCVGSGLVMRVIRDLAGNINYLPLKSYEYPDLILELRIKSAVPKTVDYIKEHNFGLVSVFQNGIEYSFNNGTKYNFSL